MVFGDSAAEPAEYLGFDPYLVMGGEQEGLIILPTLYVESRKLSRKALRLTHIVRIPTRMSTWQVEAWNFVFPLIFGLDWADCLV